MKSLICIKCPLGCRLTVYQEGENYLVEGNACQRGHEYGIQEFTAPMRMVPTTVVIHGGLYKRLPVITSGPIAKEKIKEVMAESCKVKVEAPIKVNQVVLENVANTGVDLIATRSMDRLDG